ncbi:MAG: glycosyltransferase family 4 protein [Anaerolineae bacterium]
MDKPAVLYAAFDVVPSPKGASTHISHFVQGLVNGGYRVHLVTAGDGSLPEHDNFAGATVWRVPAADEANFLERALAFGCAVMAHAETVGGYAVAHFRSLWCGLPLVQAAAHLGYRTLFEVNGLPSVELKYHYPGLRGTPLEAKIGAQEVATLLRADAIVCPSAVTREYIASLGIERDKVTVIPNGIEPRLFCATPRQASAGAATLLYVGTLADWQGLELLLEALPLVLARRDVHLRIVGRGRGRQQRELAKRARRLGVEGHVSVEDAVPHHQVPALIAAADVCVAPLAYNDRNVTQGCCPLKVLEYMACGRPVVAANLPVVRELARDGQDALLFTPDDPMDLARCVLAVLEEPSLAARLSASAAERARRRFTWARAQRRLLRVYEKLLRGG